MTDLAAPHRRQGAGAPAVLGKWGRSHSEKTSAPGGDEAGQRAGRNGKETRRTRLEAARLCLPDFKSLQFCGRRVINAAQGVTVMARPSANGGKASIRFCGVGGCGGVWTCPECASRITEERAADLIAGVKAWRAAGGIVAFMTLTIPHGRHDLLAELHDAMKKALTKLQKHRSYSDAKRDVGIIGQVRASEVTWGSVNGWHPHIHQLLFIEGNPSAEELEAFRQEVLALWKWACVANGLAEPDEVHGVDLRVGQTVDDRIAAYVAKWGKEPQFKGWGAEREMTKCHTKAAKHTGASGDRFSPFGLLDMLNFTGEEIYRDKFREYAIAYKGARQLVWSRGLRDRLASIGAVFSNRTDEEIVNDDLAQASVNEQAEVELGHIGTNMWYRMVKVGRIEWLAQQLSEDPSAQSLVRLLEEVIERHRSLSS